MANADKRYGFKFAKTTHGGPPQINEYPTSGTAAIYQGDAVKFSAGVVSACTADTDIVYGVSADWTDSTSTSTMVGVYDDLDNTIFQAQCSQADVAGASCCMAFYDLNIGTASTASNLSEMEVQSSGSVQDTILVLDKVDRPDNAWGANVDVYCKFVVHANASVRTHTGS